jgi:hypothetical protein
LTAIACLALGTLVVFLLRSDSRDHIDDAAYEWGALDRSMPFEELHRISLIDARAQAAPDTEDFWQWIRIGLPRMTPADWPPGQ